MKFIEDLKNLKNLTELETYIRNIFIKDEDERYIPAIIEVGDYTIEEGDDFYLKLVLVHHKVALKKTWLKENLAFSIIDPDSDNESIYNLFVENVITTRKVKGNSLYQLNPLMVSDSIDEYEYDNNFIINSYYNDEYSNIKGIPVLKSSENIKLLVVKDVLSLYLNKLGTNVYPKYKLIAEYEYRTHIKQEYFKAGNFNTECGIHDVLIDEQGMRVMGSVEVEIAESKYDLNKRNVKVVDLAMGAERMHNPKNFDDDRDAGLIIFKKDVIDILKKEYYFYDFLRYLINFRLEIVFL